MFAEDKSGTGFGVKVNVTPPNLLLIGNVTFVIGFDNDFNVSFFNCLLFNFVSTLDDSLSVMIVHQPAFITIL